MKRLCTPRKSRNRRKLHVLSLLVSSLLGVHITEYYSENAYRCRPKQLPESVGRDVGDADFLTSRRHVACLFVVPRRPLLLLLVMMLMTTMLRRWRWLRPTARSAGQRAAKHREEDGTARHEHVSMRPDRHRQIFAGGATRRQQREPDVAVDLTIEHVAVRLGQRQVILPIIADSWNSRRRRRQRRTRHHLSLFCTPDAPHPDSWLPQHRTKPDATFLSTFYSRDRRYASAVLVVIVCPSVRLSHAGNVPKWLNLGLHKLRHTIAERL